MKKVVLLTAALALTASFASAALLADWSAPGVTIVTDATGDNSGGAGPATDILSFGYTYQGGYHYFLMTTAAKPSAASFAGGYLLNFDYQAGGANAASSYYVASGLTGIDFILDAHYFQEVKVSNHYHNYIGGDSPQFDTIDALTHANPAVYSVEEDFGAVDVFAQEWRLNDDWFTDVLGMPFGTDFTVWASTHSTDTNDVTYDTTSGLAFTPVPEPGTMGLAGLAALLVAVRRRRQA